MLFKSKKDAKSCVVSVKPEVETEEEWVVVEGFKGTNKNMQGFDNFQFEMNETYAAEGEIELCENGFHLSLNLCDASGYHLWKEKSRYFKVKALVRKEDLKNYGKILYLHPTANRVDKLVAKEITFLEEIPLAEIYQALRLEKIHVPKDFFINFYTSDLEYRDYTERYFYNALREKYSPAFIKALFDESPDCLRTLQLALALVEEGVSPDMRAYLLLRGSKS